MSFFRSISPRAAWADLVEIWRGEQRYKLHFLGLAFITTMIIVAGFLSESDFKIEPKPNKIIYVENWPANRSDAEIIAERTALMKEINARKAARAKREQETRDSYRRLGEQFGMDVDEPAGKK